MNPYQLCSQIRKSTENRPPMRTLHPTAHGWSHHRRSGNPWRRTSDHRGRRSSPLQATESRRAGNLSSASSAGSSRTGSCRWSPSWRRCSSRTCPCDWDILLDSAKEIKLKLWLTHSPKFSDPEIGLPTVVWAGEEMIFKIWKLTMTH